MGCFLSTVYGHYGLENNILHVTDICLVRFKYVFIDYYLFYR